jgi:CDP-glucose 4,6-dehydratase
MKSVIADVRDLASLEKAMRAAEPEIVMHMAAQPLVRHSYGDPVETYATNVMGTVHLLESVRRTPRVKAVVNVTTDKCYENHGDTEGYREGDVLGGADPYSNSKACAELATAAYRASFFAEGPAVATARAGNVIGGGDWAKDRLVPDIIKAFEAGQPAHIRNPGAVRPWQQVLEPLRGYLTLAEHLYQQGAPFGEAWNFGPDADDARPVAWIADRMAALWGEGASWQADGGEHPHEAAFLRLDASKARSRLHWHPALDLQRTLELTVDWARASRTGADMRRHTLAQIESYQAATVG